MDFELCVFDVAGTTVEDDGAVADCLRAAIELRGPRPTEVALTAVMGLAKPVAISALLAVALGRAPERREVEETHQDFEDRMVEHYTLDPDIRPMFGAGGAFRALRASGVKVALDTGFSRRILDAVLARLGWRAGVVVDLTVASDEVPRGRPHPDMIHRAIRLLGVTDPRRVCKVGDTVADVREGRSARAGLVVGVTSGTCTGDALRDAGADLVLESVAEVPRRLVRLRAA